MYPSIPIDETLQLVLEELLIDESLSHRTEWKPHNIVKLTRICMETHFKTYEGYILTQTDGSPIGKSFSGCICGIFVANFEKKFVLHNKLRFRALFYGKELKMMYIAFGNMVQEKQTCFSISLIPDIYG